MIVNYRSIHTAAFAAAAVLLLPVAAVQASSVPTPRAEGWLVKSYDQIQASIPAKDLQAERTALKAITAKRTASDMARFRWWSTGGPAYRWNEMLLEEMQDSFITLPMSVRHLALFHAAIDDAIAATRYRRSGNEQLGIDDALNATIPASRSMAPSDYAAAAVAASEVLAYFFPARTDHYAAKAEEATQVRLLAGAECRRPSQPAGRSAARLRRSPSNAANPTAPMPNGPAPCRKAPAVEGQQSGRAARGHVEAVDVERRR